MSRLAMTDRGLSSMRELASSFPAAVRSGPPIDDEADFARPVWGGVVPVFMSTREPIGDDRLLADVPTIDISRLASARNR